MSNDVNGFARDTEEPLQQITLTFAGADCKIGTSGAIGPNQWAIAARIVETVATISMTQAIAPIMARRVQPIRPSLVRPS